MANRRETTCTASGLTGHAKLTRSLLSSGSAPLLSPFGPPRPPSTSSELLELSTPLSEPLFFRLSNGVRLPSWLSWPSWPHAATIIRSRWNGSLWPTSSDGAGSSARPVHEQPWSSVPSQRWSPPTYVSDDARQTSSPHLTRFRHAPRARMHASPAAAYAPSSLSARSLLSSDTSLANGSSTGSSYADAADPSCPCC